MKSSPSRISELTISYPPRFRWLRRFAFSLLVILILAFIMRLAWGHIANQRFEAEMSAVSAQGDPISFDQWPQPQIPDPQNAAWYYRKAGAAQLNPAISVSTVNWDQPTNPTQVLAFAGQLTREAAALQFVRAAQAQHVAVWSVGSLANALRAPDATAQRGLQNLLYGQTFVDSYNGDDALSLQDLRQMYHHADRMQEQFPLVVNHLIALGSDALASDAAFNIAIRVKIAPDSTPNSPSPDPRLATRQNVLDVIAALSDESALQAGQYHCIVGERMYVLDIGPTYLTPNGSISGWILQPLWRLDLVKISRYETQISAAFAQPTMPQAKAMMPQFSLPNIPSADAYAHMLSSIFTPSLQRAAETHFRVIAERRASIIAFAIALYRADNASQFPVSLNALVPKYLSAIPADPFSPASAPWLYNPASPNGPILYSVGDNGTDDGGSEAPLYKRPTPPNNRWEELDFVYHLTPKP